MQLRRVQVLFALVGAAEAALLPFLPIVLKVRGLSAAAIGVALATPGKRVVAIVGDGSSYYGIQGLWTAVEHNLPITFVIVNNGGYGAMKSFSALFNSKRSPSFDIGHVDFVALAKGFGCDARRVEKVADLAATLEAAHKSPGPILIDVAVESAMKKLF